MAARWRARGRKQAKHMHQRHPMDVLVHVQGPWRPPLSQMAAIGGGIEEDEVGALAPKSNQRPLPTPSVTDVTNSAQIFIFALLSPKRAASALLRSQASLPQSQRQVSQPCAALVLCHSRPQPSCCTTAAHSPRAMPLPLAASSQRSPSQHRTACPNAAGPCAASYVYIYLSL